MSEENVTMQQSTSPLAFLREDQRVLEEMTVQRSKQLASIVLDRYVTRMMSHAEEIRQLRDEKKSRIVLEREIRELVSACIVELCEGCLAVTEYSQKALAKQSVYIFVGTHWQLIEAQVYIDFVKHAARRCGLPGVYCEDPDFMNKVFEQVAFRVSGHRCQRTPLGEVWINLLNGTLKIASNGDLDFVDHDPEDFITYCIPYRYDERATCPRWERFAAQVLPERDLQELLAEYIGYCFTRDLKYEKMAVFYGSGSNGKSVMLDVIERLMGKQNVSNVSLSAVTTDDEKRALIEGKLVNISHECDKKLDNAMMKQLVSGEPTEVRQLYRGTHTMYQYAKFFTSFNRLPPSEYTHGFFRRWLLFPFRVTIPDGEQDTQLTAKLCQELPGILNWVLRGLRNLVRNGGFSPCEVSQQALNEYRMQSNSALMFLTECCTLTENCNTKLKDLYQSYGMFCCEEGLQGRYGKAAFREILKGWGAQCREYQGCIMYDVKTKG